MPGVLSVEDAWHGLRLALVRCLGGDVGALAERACLPYGDLPLVAVRAGVFLLGLLGRDDLGDGECDSREDVRASHSLRHQSSVSAESDSGKVLQSCPLARLCPSVVDPFEQIGVGQELRLQVNVGGAR